DRRSTCRSARSARLAGAASISCAGWPAWRSSEHDERHVSAPDLPTLVLRDRPTMTDNPTDPTTSDDPLLGQLRRLSKTIDSVPNEVTAYARAALGWRRVDAELAELLADSRLEATSGTRSIAESTRSLTFRATDVQLDVEIEESGDRLLLLGQLAPSTK